MFKIGDMIVHKIERRKRGIIIDFEHFNDDNDSRYRINWVFSETEEYKSAHIGYLTQQYVDHFYRRYLPEECI